jgi:cobalt-precorrin 5A hydrolase
MTRSLLMAIAKAKVMFRKGVVIFSLTKQGVETAVLIRDFLNTQKMDCKVIAPKKYLQNGVVSLDGKLGDSVKDYFSKADAIVAVMATGIVVRMIAPLLKSKLSDPAVVCVDTTGRFAVSLLSGHYGGANELTRLIANGIGAVPVITTASDVMGKQSVDELARMLHCDIVNPESLVAVNSALVNGEKLVVVLVGSVRIPMGEIEDYEVRRAESGEEAVEIVNGFDGGAIISHGKIQRDKLVKPATILKPRVVAVGLGARKNVSEEDVVETVKSALAQVNIPLGRVDRMATVEIKKDSVSMIRAAEALGLELEFISLDDLRAFKHGDLSPDSELVQRKIGVGGVCERAALMMAGKKANLILKKMKAKGVTVAVAEGA